MTRARLGQADSEIERLRAEDAVLAAEVADVEQWLDDARRELATAEEAADLALARGDIAAEARARQTAGTVIGTISKLEPEVRRLNERWSAVQTRLHLSERGARAVVELTDRVEVDVELVAVLETVDKAAAVADRWEQRRRETRGLVEPSRLVDTVRRLPQSTAYLAAQRRLENVPHHRRQRAEAERARITVDEETG